MVYLRIDVSTNVHILQLLTTERLDGLMIDDLDVTLNHTVDMKEYTEFQHKEYSYDE